MTQSEDIKELAAALAKAQGQMEKAKKDADNPYFKSKYADLTSIWDACREQLSQNQLAIVQATDESDDGVIVVTKLIHSSGQWMEGRLKMKPVKNDPQGIGSCISYARRYALAAMVGICTEDDDGNAASQPEPKKPEKQYNKPKAVEPQATPLAEANRLAAEIGRIMKDNHLTPEEITNITGLGSLNAAAQKGDVKALQAGKDKLLQYLMAS